MLEVLNHWLLNLGLSEFVSDFLARGFLIVGIIAGSFLLELLTRRVVLRGFDALIRRTKTHWDDALLEHGVFRHIGRLVMGIALYLFLPEAFAGMDQLVTFVTGLLSLYLIVIGVLILDALLNASQEIYNSFEVSREIPIRGFVQVAKLVIYFLALIFGISIVLGKTPLYLLSGLGALTAVLLLIFRDAILGFVAGIQLVANKMVAPGDWIEMPQYGADGDVEEVTLTVVKVRNWDKTITTIPTYALISDSFKNWRGMQESGGRRIKRAINIDLSTVQFCTEEMLERFDRIQYITEYIRKKKREISEHNRASEVSDESLVNGRRMTNVGTFRAYVTAYLKNHPKINQEMTFLVRQLEPTANGLPIEIYVFSREKAWAEYEAIQADIFDHILAVVPEFDLRVFQNPSGADFRQLVQQE